VRVVEVETATPSPFARSLLFGYVATFIYEGDSPLAERRAAALALDSMLLAELLGAADLRELLDAEAVERVEAELQRLVTDRQVRDFEGLADLLRGLGPLTTAEVEARGGTAAWLVELEAERRAIRVRIAGVEHWATVEDAGRLSDALGVALPVGVPVAFTEPIKDPLGDLLSRWARTHGPFTTTEVAARFGLGAAVAQHGLTRLQTAGRVVAGEFRPGNAGAEWCDTEVLRRLRRLSIALLRKEIEPVEPVALARFLPAWQHVGADSLRGVDGLLRAVDQLQGAPVPASALESLVLPARIIDYSPALLDELTASGEVLWAGHAALPGDDGWVSLHLADRAELLLAPPEADAVGGPVHAEVLDALADGRALFFRQIADRAGSTDDTELARAVWDLVWSGALTNDTLAPLRTLLGGRGAHRARPPAPRPRYAGRRASFGRPALPSRSGPPTVAGRWSLLPARLADPTRCAQALVDVLLDRHGVLTRGAVVAERVPGGFAATYRVLRAFEDAGRCSRAYVVAGLGAAQFALPGAVDRVRAKPDPPAGRPRALVLAATDPANAYGAALPWPPRRDEAASGHKPGRKAGALVVLVDGVLVIYVERGGRSLLTWPVPDESLQPAADALALVVREGGLGKLTVERADGAAVGESGLGRALEAAGFHATPRGLRLRN
jgi:ATP-dependent Lhr-like helicase